MTEKKTKKLNKFVLYASSITIALFGILYSFGEVKAETFYLTDEEVELYYPLDGSCDSALNKGDNLTLLNAGGDYAISWTENIFGGGLKVLGTGDENTNKSSGCYGSSGYTLDTAEGDEFTYIFTINNPSQPTSMSAPIYFGDNNRVYAEIHSNGQIRFVWVHSNNYNYVSLQTNSGVINFDGNNRKYQIAFRGTWSDNTTIGNDKRILVNGVDETTVFDWIWSSSIPYNNFLNKFYIGLGSTNSNGYNGEIGEVIVLNTKIHDDDLETLRTNSLNSMFGGGGGLNITSQYYNPRTKKLYLSGTCEKYGSGINQMNLYADSYPDPNAVMMNGGLVSCLTGNIWNAVYTDIAGNMTGDHTIYIDDSFFGTQIASIVQDFGEYYYGEETNLEELGIFNFQDSYNCSQNSSCIIRYDYNENYIPEDTNEIRLYDPDEILVATSTIESFGEFGKTNGKSRISVDITSSIPIGKYIYMVEADEDSDHLWQYGRPITINVFDGSIPDATYVWDTNEDISTLWGDSYTLACTAEEWAEADNANFFNLIRLKCHATKTTLDIGFGTLNVAKNIFSNIYESGKTLLENMFPFNMIYKVKYQWDRSAYINLPVDLALIQNATESGELSIKINKELLSSEEDVYWVLWGDDLWEENTEVKNFFNFIRVLSKYLMYALFLLGLYKMGVDFFNEYMYENKLSSQRNSDWQYDQFED